MQYSEANQSCMEEASDMESILEISFLVRLKLSVERVALRAAVRILEDILLQWGLGYVRKTRIIGPDYRFNLFHPASKKVYPVLIYLSGNSCRRIKVFVHDSMYKLSCARTGMYTSEPTCQPYVAAHQPSCYII